MCHLCGDATVVHDKPYWFYAHEERPTVTANKRLTMKEDPTKQAGNRRRAIAELKRRLNGAQKDVLAIIDDLPYTTQVVNRDSVTNLTVYQYELSAERVASIDAFIRRLLNDWFDTSTDDKPYRYFFDTYITDAVQPATVESANRIALLATQAGYTNVPSVEEVLLSQPYRRRIQLLWGRTFNEMKGFSGETATDLARVLADVVTRGRSPREAQRLIRERFGVATSRAERIARTEINNAYTTARMEEMKDARDRLEIDVRVIHRSALIPTTRRWHAERHGKMYTVEEQQEWWSVGGNKINCYCSVSEAVLDADGKPYDLGLLKRLKKERQAWGVAT